MTDWRLAAFSEVLRRMPPPVRMFDDAVICPWCGFPHDVMRLGRNLCDECRRPFFFGYPPWGETERPMSWARLTYEEECLVIEKLNRLPPFAPNARLRDIYRQWAEIDKGNEKNRTPGPVVH